MYGYEDWPLSNLFHLKEEFFSYETVGEVIKKFNEFPKDWASVIGCRLGDGHEFAMVRRVNGVPARVMDIYEHPLCLKRKDVLDAMEQLVRDLSIEYQLVYGIHPKRSVMAPMENPDYLDEYFENKVLSIRPDTRLKAYFASINELYLENDGWTDLEEFLKRYQYDAISRPETPVVKKLNVCYQLIGSGRIGKCDMSPVCYHNLMKKTKEYHLSFVDKKKPIEKQKYKEHER